MTDEPAPASMAEPAPELPMPAGTDRSEPLHSPAGVPPASAPSPPHHLLLLRIAIIAGILAALLIAGGGVDAAQQAFAHMFPGDPNPCGGG